MPEREELVLRQLPQGHQLRGFHSGFLNRLMEITPGAGEDIGKLPPGTLVEIEAPQALYFGQIYEHKDARLVVGVDHSIDLHALAAIRAIWSQAD
jgi:hypothetical protein